MLVLILTFIYGAAVAALYTFHSYRSGLATARERDNHPTHPLQNRQDPYSSSCLGKYCQDHYSSSCLGNNSGCNSARESSPYSSRVRCRISSLSYRS